MMIDLKNPTLSLVHAGVACVLLGLWLVVVSGEAARVLILAGGAFFAGGLALNHVGKLHVDLSKRMEDALVNYSLLFGYTGALLLAIVSAVALDKYITSTFPTDEAAKLTQFLLLGMQGLVLALIIRFAIVDLGIGSEKNKRTKNAFPLLHSADVINGRTVAVVLVGSPHDATVFRKYGFDVRSISESNGEYIVVIMREGNALTELVEALERLRRGD